jgi:hypothetical protein
MHLLNVNQDRCLDGGSICACQLYSRSVQDNARDAVWCMRAYLLLSADGGGNLQAVRAQRRQQIVKKKSCEV